jgi:hypothetical protein
MPSMAIEEAQKIRQAVSTPAPAPVASDPAPAPAAPAADEVPVAAETVAEPEGED